MTDILKSKAQATATTVQPTTTRPSNTPANPIPGATPTRTNPIPGATPTRI